MRMNVQLYHGALDERSWQLYDETDPSRPTSDSICSCIKIFVSVATYFVHPRLRASFELFT